MFLRKRATLILLDRTFQVATQKLMMNLIWKSATAAIDVSTPAHKQIISDLEKPLKLDNYDALPAQEYYKPEYSNASKSLQV